MKAGLLLVDDDETILTQMKWAFNKEYKVYTAGDRTEAIGIIKSEKISVVTLDLGLPPTPWDTQEGFLTLNEIGSIDSGIKVIVITGNTQKEFALKAINLGAFDFYLKPINIEEIKHTVQRAFSINSLEKQNEKLQKQIEGSNQVTIVGSSPEIIQLVRIIDQVAPTNASVLITGESGTGKEVAARSIWQKSKRKDGSFIPINCGAIPENLLESELFGYEKGAFTGANKTHIGLVEMADGGTLFLDEIGDLPFSLQVKLLRFLQESKIKRVGGQKELDVDVRVLAATNKNLQKEVEAGSFRNDLYFRLAVINVEIPPLRVRTHDIMLLAKYFLKKFSNENKKVLAGFDDSAKNALVSFDWPGNIRELENKIKRGVILAESEYITAFDLGIVADVEQVNSLQSDINMDNMSLKQAKEAFEKEFLRKILKKYNKKVADAAKELKTTRQNLHYLISKYKL